MTSPRLPQGRQLLCTWTRATPSPAARARTVLRQTLVSCELPVDMISDLVLATSELVANATEHACGPYELWLRRSVTGVVCEVHDRDPRVPDLPPAIDEPPFAPGPQDRMGGVEALCRVLSERGRGLRIVNHLSEGCWGFLLPGKGKKIAWVAFSSGLSSH
ncbi:ATP-binding protein [Streptomyces sp. NPDC003077]|uniref:ATP-binding protein n=1 Tax=Streptomyces sp. NPDC003077 TaxID=3154443 RepID=UPI0033A16241